MERVVVKRITLTALVLVLNACGGGSSTSPEDDTPIIPSPEGKGIVVCSGTDQGFSTATVLETAKEVKGLANDPSIRLWHLGDGTKKACVVSGSVEVL